MENRVTGKTRSFRIIGKPLASGPFQARTKPAKGGIEREAEPSQKFSKVVYGVFADYADDPERYGRGITINDVCIQLRISGHQIIYTSDLDPVCKDMKPFFNIKRKKASLIISWKHERKTGIPSQIVISSLVAIILVFSVLIWVKRQELNSSSQAKLERAAMESRPANSPVAVLEKKLPTIKKNASAQVILADSVNRLIDSGCFASALKIVRDSARSLDSAFALQAKNLITSLVLKKADSLRLEILALVKENKFQEAFVVDQQFDKDVFQLAGNYFSGKLCGWLLTAWVNSYNGSLSRKEAISRVNEGVKQVLNNAFWIMERNNMIFLEYTPD